MKSDNMVVVLPQPLGCGMAIVLHSAVLQSSTRQYRPANTSASLQKVFCPATFNQIPAGGIPASLIIIDIPSQIKSFLNRCCKNHVNVTLQDFMHRLTFRIAKPLPALRNSFESSPMVLICPSGKKEPNASPHPALTILFFIQGFPRRSAPRILFPAAPARTARSPRTSAPHRLPQAGIRRARPRAASPYPLP